MRSKIVISGVTPEGDMAPGARIVGSEHPALSGPVITTAFPGRDVAALRVRLWREAKAATATATATADGQALIRFSPHIYNDDDEMQAVVDVLSRTDLRV